MALVSPIKWRWIEDIYRERERVNAAGLFRLKAAAGKDAQTRKRKRGGGDAGGNDAAGGSGGDDAAGAAGGEGDGGVPPAKRSKDEDRAAAARQRFLERKRLRELRDRE